MKGIRLLFLSGMLFFAFSCSSHKDIVIGFIGDFSSGHAEMATQCRNAVEMAVSEINGKGGILGKQLSVLYGDNGNTATPGRKIIEDFEQRGIHFIIAACTSQLAIPLLSDISGKDMLIISPVVNSDVFEGKDDNFFRIQPNASREGMEIGYALSDRRDKSAVLVRSLKNDIYTNAFMSGIRKALREDNISIEGDFSFSDREEWDSLIGRIVTLNPDALVISAEGNDAGFFIQQCAREGILPHLYGDIWSATTGVDVYGGKFCEGMITGGLLNNNGDKNLEREFNQKYYSLYSVDPVFYAVYSYESVLMLAKGMEDSRKIPTAAQMKEYLLEMDDFEGVLGPLSFDRYGDSLRDIRLYIIRNGKYVPF